MKRILSLLLISILSITMSHAFVVSASESTENAESTKSTEISKDAETVNSEPKEETTTRESGEASIENTENDTKTATTEATTTTETNTNKDHIKKATAVSTTTEVPANTEKNTTKTTTTTTATTEKEYNDLDDDDPLPKVDLNECVGDPLPKREVDGIEKHLFSPPKDIKIQPNKKTSAAKTKTTVPSSKETTAEKTSDNFSWTLWANIILFSMGSGLIIKRIRATKK